MARIFVKSYSSTKDILKVNLEGLIVINVFERCATDVLILSVIQDFSSSLEKTLFEISTDGLKFETLLLNQVPDEAKFCIWPVVVFNETAISGLASVCRHVIKISANPITISLLGFRDACLLACSEASIWTKFCEIDIISTVYNLLTELNEQASCFSLPKDLSRFESHLNQPVRIHNVYKLARERNNDKLLKSDTPIERLNLEHRYAEGPYMTLADLLLYPCYRIIFQVLDLNLVEKLLPLSVAWYQNLCSEQFGSLVSFNLPKEVNAPVGCELVLEQEINKNSLYKGDSTKSKQQNKIYTKQENVIAALLKTNCLISSTDEQFASDVDILWSDIPLDANPLGGALPKSRANRKLGQLESLARVVIKIAKSDHLTIVDFCSGSGHLGILVATLLKNCRVILVENKERSLQRARERVRNLKLTNVSLVQSNLDYFIGPFDIGMSLHACGVATDLVIQTCLKNKAQFVCCPCCYGSINDCLSLSYPRSKIFRTSLLNYEDYLTVCHSADQTHDEENSKTSQGYICMNVVDTDRKLQAEEFGYKVYLNKLYPLNCTPKNNLLIGIYANK